MAADGFGEEFVLESGDLSLKTPSGKTNGSYAQFLLAYPDAFAAEDTLVGIVGEEGTTVVHGESPFELLEPLAFQLEAQMFSNRLELAQSVFLHNGRSPQYDWQ